MLLSIIFIFSLSAHASLRCENPAPTLQKNIGGICDKMDAEAERHCNQDRVKPEVQNFPKVSYGMFGALGAMTGLYEAINNAQEKFLSSQNDCPAGCSQKSTSIVEIETQPVELDESTECAKKKYETLIVKDESFLQRHGIIQSKSTGQFLKAFKLSAPVEKCQSEAKDYAQGIVMAKSKFGKELESRECPSPCSYSSVIQITTHKEAKSGCHVEAALTIKCGPPRKSAKWSTDARLTKSYRCEAPR